MLFNTPWNIIKNIYLIGFAVATLVTFFISHDKSLWVRLVASLIIGLTWPLSFPLVLIFAFF